MESMAELLEQCGAGSEAQTLRSAQYDT
jgi:hypothetical protein